jgi:hypothetical protein
MKTPVTPTWIPGLVLVMIWLPFGMAQKETDPTRPLAPSSIPVVTSAPIRSDAVFPATTAPHDSRALATPSHGSDALVQKRQPPRIRLSPWTSEIVKLAESGIEAGVILSFIENSGTFNLGADQIIYLNDLGFSSEIISAMLQHDRELISGVRPLTVASEPDWQLTFDSTFVPIGDGPTRTISTPIVAAPRSSATGEPGNTPKAETLPEANRVAAVNQIATLNPISPDAFEPMNSAAFDWQAGSEDRKKNVYPVREPYPVEITAPIIFINAESRPANTVVVLGFPRNAP